MSLNEAMFLGRLILAVLWTLVTVTAALQAPEHGEDLKRQDKSREKEGHPWLTINNFSGSTSLRPRAPSSKNPNIESLDEISRNEAYKKGIMVGSCICAKKFQVRYPEVHFLVVYSMCWASVLENCD